MCLRTKFNLVLLLVFVLGLCGSGAVFYSMLQQHAREEVVQNASVMMAAAMAVRGYTVEHVKPNLIEKSKETFLPETVPAFAATAVFNNLRKNYNDYLYKEATLNPTNQSNRAVEWENDIIQEFRNTPDKVEMVGERQTTSGPALYLARPIKVQSNTCLECHGVASAAPKPMLANYGDKNGFGWKLNEVIGAQIVSVPMRIPIQKAERAFYTFITSLVCVFLIVFIVLNFMLRSIVIKPIVRMSKTAEAVSMGNMEMPEFTLRGTDEVSQLAHAFNRMRRSLEKAMKMLE